MTTPNLDESVQLVYPHSPKENVIYCIGTTTVL